MNAHRSIQIYSDGEELAQVVANKLLDVIIAGQKDHKPVHIVLTGGRIAAKAYRHVVSSEKRADVDWFGVHFWWGDERFLPTGNAERNETQAREAFLDALEIEPEQLHPMPSADTVDTVEESAALYRDDLDVAGHGPSGSSTGTTVPQFDLVLLGIGEDGHVASLFPGNLALDAVDEVVVGVHNAPKAPSDRVSLSFKTLNSAKETWVIASGEGKAEPVAAAWEGTELNGALVPAGNVRARGETVWMLDRPAASIIKI